MFIYGTPLPMERAEKTVQENANLVWSAKIFHENFGYSHFMASAPGLHWSANKI